MSYFKVFLNIKKTSLSIEILFKFFPLKNKSLSHIYINTPISKNYLTYIIVALNVLTSHYYFSIIPFTIDLVIKYLRFF